MSSFIGVAQYIIFRDFSRAVRQEKEMDRIKIGTKEANGGMVFMHRNIMCCLSMEEHKETGIFIQCGYLVSMYKDNKTLQLTTAGTEAKDIELIS